MPVDGAPRRVLMTADAVGGVWDYALELTTALASRGVAVTLATMGPRPTSTQRAALRDLPNTTVVESDYSLEWMTDADGDVDAAGEWLLALARDCGAELVHLNGYAHAALPWPMPALVVAHSCVWSWWSAVHGGSPPAEWRAYHDRVRRGIAAASAIAAPSAAMLRALAAHYGPCDGTVIPNGRCPVRFRPAAKEPFIFAAGRVWDPAKNLAALSAAASRVEWPIVVAGDTTGPDGAAHVPRGVTALGRIGPLEMRDRLGRASIYAMPAKYEPFGLSILEAALSGCALVVGDIPSLREHWDGAALFVAPGDRDALAAALAGLIADGPRRERWGRRARVRGMEFTATRMADAYERLYAGMRAGAARPAGSSACAS
jgi:glycosyltransferase involved in cell wall biosynthesis